MGWGDRPGMRDSAVIEKSEKRIGYLENGMSQDEFNILKSREVDDSELIEVMEMAKIEFNTGIAEINVDGEKIRINTDREDFGTIAPAELS